MNFYSILFEKFEDGIKEKSLDVPNFFVDLNLDQVIDTITIGKQEYNLKPFFYSPLKDIDTIKYRHEIMRDLEDSNIFENIKSFAQKMHTMREHLAQADKLSYKYQKESWFLDAVEIYCDAVNCLMHDLSTANIRSRGLLTFREYLKEYTSSDDFESLLTETKKLKNDLSTVKYWLIIKDNSITVRKYGSEIDYSADVEKTFEKFKQGAVRNYKVEFPNRIEMNHVEAKILDFVAQLYSDIFSDLDNYCAKNSNYLNETIGMFDREIQFYIAYLEHIAPFRQVGLKFCYPQITNKSKEIYGYEVFDLALAYKLIMEKSSVVCNDFCLKGKERIFVVSGPNQGGKTTFARTFGQLHYLASIGCPVPGSEAQLFLCDNIFTHFEKEEDVEDLRGKLEDDLIRIHSILKQSTSNSIVIINEIFTSTTLKDAVFLSKKVMEKIIQLDLLCVWVTFVHELSELSEKIVSMVSTVVPENPALRTYKIIRRPADGVSYAISIAEKYNLTYDRLKERIKS